VSRASTAGHSIGRRCLLAATCLLIGIHPAGAQIRGVYPPGMSALNSGVTPEPGFSYGNMLLFYGRDESKGADGEVIATGNNSVILAMNSIVWVGSREVLGGARFSMSATLPLSNNSLTSDNAGAISGGGGFADSYYQPFILGWSRPRLGIRAVYGFLAPTGEYSATSSSNVGSGYWTHVLASGQTWYLTGDGRTSLSTFQMYEFHTKQQETGIRPGDTLDLDYSVTRTVPLNADASLQFGLAGYHQWQMTDKRVPGVPPAPPDARYVVNAMGVAGNVAWPRRGVSLGVKYLQEFLNRSTFQGYSTQISGSIAF
jgi:hypothetical protein